MYEDEVFVRRIKRTYIFMSILDSSNQHLKSFYHISDQSTANGPVQSKPKKEQAGGGRDNQLLFWKKLALKPFCHPSRSIQI